MQQRRRVTMTDVARAAGVSPMTVSYTYNRPQRVSAETREAVLAAAARLGYGGPDPSARSLRYGATRTLGVVLGEHLTYAFDNPQAVEFLAGIAEVCADRGYGMLIVPTGAGPDDPDRVAAAAVDGYVVWTTTDDDPVLTAARGSGRPVIVHGGSFTIDNRAAARAVGLVVFAGAGRPAVLSFPVDRARDTFVTAGLSAAAYPVTRDRLDGYRDAVVELGLDWNSVPVGVCRTNDEAEARRVMELLLSAAPDIDAVAAMNDPMAHAARLALPSARVAGWDDSALATTAGLTTVAQSLRSQGAACAAAALGEAASSQRDAWRVIERDSTT
ncbi:LacI family transcriptional regulator [Paractinoplanes abujensis]|uniref:DNA-binding LacI/PurR family transcriptional regulator n=1 Tax=Paractinoplanes abujensis TaxID=882441 RepID=A0A7W7FZV2_9ACTN|nr:LacI family DNA-binding transcriptional regulator [Actinoplanes abujensis]MBB4690954.1 DNA-binding LacI/PurR family transcriptional regulator [Actinoplanes abujensis]GID17633.1 LacI family transcriptional regulator [Actinoplanes abujensis]